VSEPGSLSPRQKAELCASLLVERKAENLLALHVGPLVGYADYFLLASGRSSRHVRAIAEFIQEKMADRGLKPLGVEGLSEATWVLLDYNEVILHVFHEPVRRFYDLEGLWSDAPRLELPEVKETPAASP
jgi:ribosome-associated protein